MATDDGISEFRFRDLDRRVTNIEERGTSHTALLDRELTHIRDEIASMSRDVKRNNRVLIGLLVTIAAASIMFAITLTAGGGGP